MFDKQNSKLFTFKDLVSILIVFTIIGLSICSVWAAAITNAVKAEGKPVSTRNLAMFASIAYADLNKIAGYNVPSDSNSSANTSDEKLDLLESQILLLIQTQNLSKEEYKTQIEKLTKEIEDLKNIAPETKD